MRAIRSFFRQIRNGFRNLFRNGWMTTATILVMTVALIVVGGLGLVIENVDNVVTDIEEGIQIRVHIDVAANEADEENLGNSISEIPHVQEVTYRTKDEELEKLIAEAGDEFQLFEGDGNPLYNVYLVEVDDVEYIGEVQDQIKELPHVAEVNYGDLDTDNLIKSLNILRVILALVAAVLVVIAVLLVTNTIRMTINARQNEIEIMRLVGAKNSYIRAPFIFEGGFIGLISALFAVALLYAMYEGLQQATIEIVGVQILSLVPIRPLIWQIGGVLIVIGVILGMIGARRSVSRFLTI